MLNIAAGGDGSVEIVSCLRRNSPVFRGEWPQAPGFGRSRNCLWTIFVILPRASCLSWPASKARRAPEPPGASIDELLPAIHLPVLCADVRRRRPRGPQGQPDRRGDRADGLSGGQGAPGRGRRNRRPDRRRDRLHGGRLGQEGPRGQGGLADQSDAQARPRNADRHPGPAQALRGHSGRGARLSSTATCSWPRRRPNSSPRTWSAA